MSALVFPGDVVGNAAESLPGEGTYVSGLHIVATVIGTRHVDTTTVVKVIPQRAPLPLPIMGSVVLSVVTRVSRTAAYVDITHVDGRVCPFPLHAVLRGDEIRPDPTVPIHNSFRAGDHVCASVVSVADARSYVLSTMEPDLGVIAGRSEAGAPLERVEGRDDVMRCTKTGRLEERWVAVA